ncbi:MAG: PEP-CTERM sorting domain-containing protein [Armatimonadota bacterium]
MKYFAVVVLVLTLFALPALSASADEPKDTASTFVIDIMNTNGQLGTFNTATIGTWENVIGENGNPRTTYSFTSANGYDVLSTDGNTVLGTIYSLNFEGEEDPQVIVNFSCKAGSADTTFSFKNTTDVVPTITNPIARASASLTLTDNSVPTNGSYATGAFDGSCYQARYNNGTVFTNLVDGFSITGGSLTSSNNDPVDGVSYRQVSGTVTQMEAEYRFTLKKYDSASGTSNFVMLPSVPEPSSMLGLGSALIGLIGFGLKKRK